MMTFLENKKKFGKVRTILGSKDILESEHIFFESEDFLEECICVK